MASGADRKANAARAQKGIKILADKGAKIICLPELFISEYFCQKQDPSVLLTAEPIPDGPTTSLLMNAARDNRVSIITSVYERLDDATRYNTAVVIGPDGSLEGIYRKMHIPYDPAHHYDEGFYFGPGDLGYQVIETQGVKVAPLICYDQWFPEAARVAAQKGAQILLYPTAIGWPDGDRKDLNEAEHSAWQIMHRAHAIANNIHVVAVNRVGRDQHLRFWGTSMVADPYGRVLGKASCEEESEMVVECDLRVTEEMRKSWPFLDDTAREAAARKKNAL